MKYELYVENRGRVGSSGNYSEIYDAMLYYALYIIDAGEKATILVSYDNGEVEVVAEAYKEGEKDILLDITLALE